MTLQVNAVLSPTVTPNNPPNYKIIYLFIYLWSENEVNGQKVNGGKRDEIHQEIYN